MKKIIFISVLLTASFIIKAQVPQFAVVRPNGTTYICPTWDSAYNKAVENDNIYLPGTTISQILLTKKIFLYGAGHHPDSSLTTGRTIVNNLTVLGGASGGSIEGISYGNILSLGDPSRKLTNFLVKRCKLGEVRIGVQGSPIDSLPTNIIISENVIEALNGYSSSSHLFEKNIFHNSFMNISNSEIRNNIFLGIEGQFYNPLSVISDGSFYNTIFLAQSPFYNNGACTNYFYNTLRLAGSYLACSPQNYTEVGSITVATANDIFVSYATNGAGYPYVDNYHLKPTCPGVNAGTDGTDVGIYGTLSPTSQGWVPSNPHIYFKQVAPQTNTNGQLQIQFKVRTNN